MTTLACVTGATGFLGGHVARRLLERGSGVRATYRDPERRGRLAAIGDVEPVEASGLDADALRHAFRGCDVVYNVAGFVGSRPRSRAFTDNALLPRVVVEAAASAGVRRVVHTSSLAGIGASPARPCVEDDVYETGMFGLTYADSKHEGEYEALAASARCGVEVVIVNPSYILGVPLDRLPEGETSTRVIGSYLRGRLPGMIDSGLNVVDVLDVAAGQVLAAERGRPGHRYVLGGHNLSWVQLLERVALLSGVRNPLMVLPRQTADLFEAVELLRVPLPMRAEAVRLMSLDWQGSSEKARAELGYRPRPLDETLSSTIDWHRDLIEQGHFARRDGTSPRSLLASGLRTFQGAPLMALLRPVERVSGVRLMACGS